MAKKLELTYLLEGVQDAAKRCLSFADQASVVTLTGSLGAGKTTLVSAIFKQYGVTEPVVSPTFTYMNVYRLAGGKVVYHFDLYRLDALQDFEQAGFSEYLYQENSICFIEWPEVIMPLLTKSVCHLSIDFMGLEQRSLIARRID